MDTKYKVLVTARSFGTADGHALQLLEDGGCEIKKLTAGAESIEEQLVRELPKADAVIAGLEVYDKPLIDAAKGRLKVISRYGVGCDNVDIDAAKAAGVAVTNTPNANTDAVADLACALMMDCARHVCVMNASVKNRAQIRPQGLEVWGKTLGVVGAGHIGKGVARRLKGFSMRILCCDQYQDPVFAEEVGARYVDFETLVRESDFITLHLPLTPETRGMFSEKEFRMMKKDAVIVNTARGGIIDEEALAKALEAGEICAAGLDVTVVEPPYDSPLMKLDNCILTPHAGGVTREAVAAMSNMAAENALAVLTAGSCKYTV